MDIFGISTALRGVLNVYFRSSRATGRTTHLLNSVRNGDIVVFSNHEEAVRVEWLAKHGNNVIIQAKTIEPDLDSLKDRLREYRGSSLILDHTWLELYYSEAVEQASLRLDDTVKRFSQENSEKTEMPNTTAKWR